MFCALYLWIHNISQQQFIVTIQHGAFLIRGTGYCVVSKYEVPHFGSLYWSGFHLINNVWNHFHWIVFWKYNIQPMRTCQTRYLESTHIRATSSGVLISQLELKKMVYIYNKVLTNQLRHEIDNVSNKFIIQWIKPYTTNAHYCSIQFTIKTVNSNMFRSLKDHLQEENVNQLCIKHSS